MCVSQDMAFFLKKDKKIFVLLLGTQFTQKVFYLEKMWKFAQRIDRSFSALHTT